MIFGRNSNVRTRGFREMYRALPKEVQEEAVAAFQQFLQNPTHSSLRLHSLQNRSRGHHRDGTMSVSVTKSYRALFVVEGGKNVWYWIGTHADHDTFTGKK